MRMLLHCLMLVNCLDFLGPVCNSAARDIFVSNVEGDDRAQGRRSHPALGIDGPVRTIAKALRLAEAGDRIVVSNTGQPYRESLSLTGHKHSGSPVNTFTIEGNDAMLDGSQPIPAGAWTYHVGGVFYFEPTGLGYQQLFLRGRPAVRQPAAAADVTLPPLEPLEWCLWQGRIYFRVEAGQLPSDYEPACCGLRTAITLYHVQDVVIENLIIHGYQFDGVNAIDAARRIQLNELVCRANGRSGITAAGASTVEINACLLGDNGEAQFRSEDYAQTHVNQSELLSDTAPAIQLQGGEVTVDGQIAISSEH